MNNNKIRIISSSDALSYYMKHNNLDYKFSVLILDKDNIIIEFLSLSNRLFNKDYFNLKYLMSIILKHNGSSIYIMEDVDLDDFITTNQRDLRLAKIYRIGKLLNIKMLDYLIVFDSNYKKIILSRNK